MTTRFSAASVAFSMTYLPMSQEEGVFSVRRGVNSGTIFDRSEWR